MGHSRTGGHSFLLPGCEIMIFPVFITVKMKDQLLVLTWGSYLQKHAERAVSEGMLLETGFGNFILVSCQSVWGWAHVCVVFLFL